MAEATAYLSTIRERAKLAISIRTEIEWSAPREFRWSAIDDDTYDGAPDSSTRGEIGWGSTESEAVEDLLRLKAERAEYLETRS